jgi:hypothetical protein
LYALLWCSGKTPGLKRRTTSLLPEEPGEDLVRGKARRSLEDVGEHYLRHPRRRDEEARRGGDREGVDVRRVLADGDDDVVEEVAERRPLEQKERGGVREVEVEELEAKRCEVLGLEPLERSPEAAGADGLRPASLVNEDAGYFSGTRRKPLGFGGGGGGGAETTFIE